MAYSHGSVVLAPANFKGGVRPYLIVSNERRPFQGDEYTVATITTTARTDAVELQPGDLTEGRLVRYPSFVNPWGLHVFRSERVQKRVAQVGDRVMGHVSDEISRFVEPV